MSADVLEAHVTQWSPPPLGCLSEDVRPISCGPPLPYVRKIIYAYDMYIHTLIHIVFFFFFFIFISSTYIYNIYVVHDIRLTFSKLGLKPYYISTYIHRALRVIHHLSMVTCPKINMYKN